MGQNPLITIKNQLKPVGGPKTPKKLQKPCKAGLGWPKNILKTFINQVKWAKNTQKLKKNKKKTCKTGLHGPKTPKNFHKPG